MRYTRLIMLIIHYLTSAAREQRDVIVTLWRHTYFWIDIIHSERIACEN